MKKLFLMIVVLTTCLSAAGFMFENAAEENCNERVFNIDDLYDYQKDFKSEEITVCAGNSTKTYMDYRATTARDSKQYWFIHDEMTVDEQTGFLYDCDGFIGVALGSFYGEIGDRYYFTLETGVVLPLVKCEEKADSDTDAMGCYHTSDYSVIEFVIDKDCALSYFGRLSNDYVLNGNYNNYSLFNGQIVKVEKVLPEKNDKYVTFSKKQNVGTINYDIFEYASGY